MNFHYLYLLHLKLSSDPLPSKGVSNFSRRPKVGSKQKRESDTRKFGECSFNHYDIAIDSYGLVNTLYMMM
jgi:hypothetical protein